MIGKHISAIKRQSRVGLSVFILGIWIAWEIGGKIVASDLGPIEYFALACIGVAVAIAILRDWRQGFYIFLVWLLFEDLVRKFLGNNMAIYFAKDVLVGLVYISFYAQVRRGRAKTFRPPFLIFLGLFFWLAIVQVFNTNSSSIFYGLLGLKLYFYYIPLMFVGYALIRSDEDLRKFFVVNAVLAGVIGALGIMQAIIGNSFLNPVTLAPALQELGDLDKVTPLTNQILSLPSSVFVSSGRFAIYLIVAAILMMGAAGYLLLYTKRSRKLIYAAFGIIGGATLFSGSRGAVVYVCASALVLAVGFLWGAPWRWGQAHRLVRAIRRTFIVAALALAALLLAFPDAAGSRLAYYTQTLSPNSSAYAVSARSWSYPIENLKLAFTNPNWVLGNGTGTASLGTQYVASMLGTPTTTSWVEEGYGAMILEMGIIAPFLWILWTAALLIGAWKVVRSLRQTRFFPIAFAIFWWAFLLLYPFTYGGLASYQNFVCNAYLWLLIGILFRLPEIYARKHTRVS
ncbi:MAG: hypothetical protein ACRD4S_04625 [Candidatus Acidiferrales bacterium]